MNALRCFARHFSPGDVTSGPIAAEISTIVRVSSIGSLLDLRLAPSPRLPRHPTMQKPKVQLAREQGLCTSSVLASTLGSTTHQPPVGAPQAAAASATAAKTAEGAAQKPPSPLGNTAAGATAGAASAAARQASGAARQAGAAISSSRAFSDGWAAIPPVARTLGLAGGAAKHVTHQLTAHEDDTCLSCCECTQQLQSVLKRPCYPSSWLRACFALAVDKERRLLHRSVTLQAATIAPTHDVRR